MKKVMIVIIGFTILKCGTTPKVVQINLDQPLEKRQKLYEENKIINSPAFFKPSNIIGKNRYTNESLSPLFFNATYTSQESRDYFSSYQTYELLVSIFSAAGGFMVGWNLGRSLRGEPAITEFYIGGGASIAVAIIFGLIGESKFQNAVSGYNVDLKTALKLERMSFYIKPEHRNYAWVDSRF